MSEPYYTHIQAGWLREPNGKYIVYFDAMTEGSDEYERYNLVGREFSTVEEAKLFCERIASDLCIKLNLTQHKIT